MTTLRTTPHGFQFGEATVTALAAIDRGRGTYVVIGLRTQHRSLEIYISPKGKSVRAFLDRRELK